MRSESAIGCIEITKNSERFLCKRNRLITVPTLRLAAFLERQVECKTDFRAGTTVNHS